jgi:hypothetical protein
MVLLFDKSLSMAPFFGEAKSYVAGEVLGPILIPGDRLVIELVYGKVERLWSGTIETEADKAAAIRKIRTVVADGRFTDLGAALDAAKRDIDELGMPDRPKYVLLVTDEKQEAPPGSPYKANDNKLRHPFLDYVKKKDLGKFRAITVGIGVEAKVEAAAPQVMKFLSEPPARGSLGTMPAEESSANPSSSQAAGKAAQAGAASGAGVKGSGAAAGTAAGAAGAPPASAAFAVPGSQAQGAASAWILPAGAGLLVLAIGAFVLLQLKKGKSSPKKDPHDA